MQALSYEIQQNDLDVSLWVEGEEISHTYIGPQVYDYLKEFQINTSYFKEILVNRINKFFQGEIINPIEIYILGKDLTKYKALYISLKKGFFNVGVAFYDTDSCETGPDGIPEDVRMEMRFSAHKFVYGNQSKCITF
jgi:hypothetical protein